MHLRSKRNRLPDLEEVEVESSVPHSTTVQSSLASLEVEASVSEKRKYARIPILGTEHGTASVIPLVAPLAAIVDQYKQAMPHHVRFYTADLRNVDWDQLLCILGTLQPIKQQHIEQVPLLFVPFAAVLLDPPWEAQKGLTVADIVRLVPISRILPSTGIVLLWCPRCLLHEAVTTLQTLGFAYAEYLTQLRYNASGTHPESGKDSPMISATLLIFQKNVPRIALQHQRNIDVVEVWGQPSGRRSVDCVYGILETMITVGRFLEVWGNPQNQRKRWVSVVPMPVA